MPVGWTDQLAQLVAFYAKNPRPEHPFYLYQATGPVAVAWPAEFPRPSALLEFYDICGGGRFGFVDRFIPTQEVPVWTGRWVSGLADEAGHPLLSPERHVVFANDADGTPWILDGVTGRVASYYFKGGSWEEPAFETFDQFMEYALSDAEADTEWGVVARAIFV